jgi:hypothetical protein
MTIITAIAGTGRQTAGPADARRRPMNPDEDQVTGSEPLPYDQGAHKDDEVEQ